MWVHLRAASGQRYSKPAWRLLWRLGVVCLLGRVRALSPLAPLTRTFSPSGICGDIQRAGALCQGGQAAPGHALHLQDHGACTAMNGLVTVCTASPSPSPILSANHPKPRPTRSHISVRDRPLGHCTPPLTQSVFLHTLRPTLPSGTAPPAATVCSQRRPQCHQCRSHPWCCPLRR